jgi:uncharacterized protein (DUF885 family)
MQIQAVKSTVTVLCLACVLICCNAIAKPKPNSSSLQDDTREQLITLANLYEKEFFNYFPETGLLLGRNDVALDRFMDHSLSANKKWQQREDDFLSALYKLDENALQDSPQYITYRLLKDTLENNKAARICNETLWKVSPISGWHIETTSIAEMQPVGTTEYRAMALKRWSTFAHVVDDEINNLKEGEIQGFTAPKVAVNRVLKQLKIILNSTPVDSPYFNFAQRDGDEAFKEEVLHLIETIINPALQRYVDYLEHDYLPVARNEIGVSALPNGVGCYQAKVKQETTLTISPREIYEYGIQHMETLKKEVATIGLKEFGVDDMSLVFQLAMSKPEYLFHSEQHILNYNLAALERVQSKIHDWFSVLPTIKGIIKPYPEYRAKTGAAGEYQPPSDDGTQPGIFYINTYDPEKQSRIDHEGTLFHELIPGHHLQVALTYEDKTHHSLDKYLWNSGYGEGWALYVERLANEMKLYSDDISLLGMLSNESLRTARLVVDPGMHVMNWTREQAIDYLRQHTACNQNTIEGEVDRYIMLPGQATSYMLGKREIEVLRQLAKTKLQDKFDIREFHNQILKNGAVSLSMLREQIQKWLEL